MLTLHYRPRTDAARARWLLEELGAPYELKPLDAPAPVPLLVDDALTLFVPSAIMLHLGDRGLAPAHDSPERADYLQWLLFAETVLAPSVKALLGAPEAPVLQEQLETVLKLLDERLSGREVLVGAQFTAADVSAASLLHLAFHLGQLAAWPKLAEYVKRHTSRPASRRAVS